MKTIILKLNKKINLNKIKQASKYILKGELVAFPTETVYGLGASVFNEKAIKNIFKVKGRAQDNPLIVHISSVDQLDILTDKISKNAKKLINHFWPGPLTIVFRKRKIVPSIVTAKLNTVAVRMPDNQIALNLIKLSYVPIVAPSANKSTRPSPTKAEHVINDFKNEIKCVIDGGTCNIGIESTVIDLTSSIPIILRPGKITKEDIEKVIGKVDVLKNKNYKIVKSPGLKYKHYSPLAKVYLISEKKSFEKEVIKLINNKRYSILSLDKISLKNKNIIYKKRYLTIEKYAQNIFNDFRMSDKKNIDIIIIQGIKEKQFGFSIMNRLKKASFKII
jgi:L-threonylcarbamoyladenylate synthase